MMLMTAVVAAALGLGFGEVQAADAQLLERVRHQARALGADIRTLRFEAPAVPAGRPVAARPVVSGIMEFLAQGAGRGVSQYFTKSSCLFCFEHKAKAMNDARARARQAVWDRCSEAKASLKGEVTINELTCERIDGWVSYYTCGAQASGMCQRLIRVPDLR